MAMSTTPARRQGRSALVVGFVLVLIVCGALVSELLPDYDRYIPLLIGVGLLAVFFVTRAYIALVFGAILTGVGAGLLVSDAFYRTADADGPGATLGLGFGFLGIWAVSYVMRLREHHFWPLIPGGILLLVHSALCGAATTVARLRDQGLAARVVRRAEIPWGPVLSARRSWLSRQGLAPESATREELVVIRAERP